MSVINTKLSDRQSWTERDRTAKVVIIYNYIRSHLITNNNLHTKLSEPEVKTIILSRIDGFDVTTST